MSRLRDDRGAAVVDFALTSGLLALSGIVAIYLVLLMVLLAKQLDEVTSDDHNAHTIIEMVDGLRVEREGAGLEIVHVCHGAYPQRCEGMNIDV